MLTLLPRKIRRLSMPDLLRQIDPGVAAVRQSREKLFTTGGFIDSLLRYRVFQRYGICLLRSLVLFKFLRLQGWPVEIHFGVRKSDDRVDDITGHSWLVLDGAPFLEQEHQRDAFTTTYTYTG